MKRVFSFLLLVSLGYCSSAFVLTNAFAGTLADAIFFVISVLSRVELWLFTVDSDIVFKIFTVGGHPAVEFKNNHHAVHSLPKISPIVPWSKMGKRGNSVSPPR